MIKTYKSIIYIAVAIVLLLSSIIGIRRYKASICDKRDAAAIWLFPFNKKEREIFKSNWNKLIEYAEQENYQKVEDEYGEPTELYIYIIKKYEHKVLDDVCGFGWEVKNKNGKYIGYFYPMNPDGASIYLDEAKKKNIIPKGIVAVAL